MWEEKLQEILKECSDGIFSKLVNFSTNRFIEKYDSFVIFGAGSGGLKTKRYLEKLGKNVVYFVDNDVNKKGLLIEGKIVKHPSEILIFEHKIIIASQWWKEIKTQLEKDYGLIWILDYILTPVMVINEMEKPNTQENFLVTLKENFRKYLEVFDLLADEDSKITYYRVLKGRVFYGFTFIPESAFRQYYHPLVKPQDDDIIVDAGAYRADTIEEIIKQGIKFKKIYAFEPDKQNYNELIKYTKSWQNIECYKYGIWDKEEKLYFIAESNMGSVITSNPDKANQIIDTISLDNFFKDKEKPTLIKMDIEGAEFEALVGAKKIISQYKPKLQICIYHKPQHLWQIPILLKELVPEYNLYIGHHTGDFRETVLYARA